MKRTIRRNLDDLPYSMHDMWVTRMCADGDVLTMEFANGFVKVGAPCVKVAGELRFHGVDWDFCHAYTLDFCGNEGPFTGRKQYLREFIAENPRLRLEIVDETYGCNTSRFAGYLSAGSALKECSIEICHLGDMEFCTEE